MFLSATTESVEPVSIHGEFGTETSQHPWSSMEKWYGDLSATMECHDELVNVDTLME